MRGDAAKHAPGGFTLVELLIVVVIVGILAAVALWRMNGVRQEAHLSVLKSDLRSLTVAQEIHHQLTMQYAEVEDLSPFRPTAGVTIDMTWIAPNGYAAVAVHDALPGLTCGVFQGDAAEGIAGPAEVESEITCE